MSTRQTSAAGRGVTLDVPNGVGNVSGLGWTEDGRVITVIVSDGLLPRCDHAPGARTPGKVPKARTHRPRTSRRPSDARAAAPAHVCADAAA